MLRFCEDVSRRQTLECMTNDFPVDEISGVQDRKTGNAVETGSGEIKVIANPDHIRIGVVSMNDRILIITSKSPNNTWPQKGTKGTKY
jgi:hypothetical protein